MPVKKEKTYKVTVFLKSVSFRYVTLLRSDYIHPPPATSLIPSPRVPFIMDPVISQIRHELIAQADPGIQKTSQRFFKEEIRCHGMKTATVIAIAKKYWKAVRDRPKLEIFALCEELYHSGYLEESFIVSEWAHALAGRYEREDIAVFRRWIDTVHHELGLL